MENNNIINGNCWVAYFDILGFKNRLSKVLGYSKTDEEVPPAMDAFVEVYYKTILRKLQEKGKWLPDKVSIHWFSDTFLLYTFDDSPESFLCIERSARHFFSKIICKRIPLRGALGIGAFYADKENGIFLGPALIDAYQYAEKQHWIGLVLTPKACSESQKWNLCPPDRGKYIKCDVPMKGGEIEELFAYKREMIVNGENVLLNPIRQMQEEAKQRHPDEYERRYKAKYENTLKFMQQTR